MTDASPSDSRVKPRVQVSPVNSSGGQPGPGPHIRGQGRGAACERGGRVNSEVIEAGLL